MNKSKSGLSAGVIALAILASYLGINPNENGEAQTNNTNLLAISNYYEARSIFWQELYPSGGETLYCGETFGSSHDESINIEHVFPMSWVAWKLECGKRHECRENSAAFNLVEADLHNLYPARADINEIRGSHPFGTVKGEKREYGQCDFELDKQKRLVEPRESVRGDIARAMFYMADRYDLEIRKRQYDLLKAWERSDPVTEEERQRNKRINSIQGNLNPYIK